MKKTISRKGRILAAVHGRAAFRKDPPFERGFAAYLRAQFSREFLVDLYARFAHGPGEFDARMRRIIWRAVAKRFGDGVRIGVGVGFKHLETFEIGDGAFIGDHAYLQGRFDGRCVIGSRAWIGPQAYLDARDLVIEDYVGWGPGAKVLGSQHLEQAPDVPLIRCDLLCRPVRIRRGADVGTNAVVLPGVTVGAGSIVGAGAVVTENVPPRAVVAGVPARFLRWRKGLRKAGRGSRSGSQ
jgi:acetyltransferase-like isoleucine patch superfamily enzyme